MMTDVTNAAPYWDPYNAEQRETPYDAWRRLRDEAPVYYNERFGFWALSRFSDVLAASLDTETFSSARGITLDSIGDPIPFPIMIMMDPPLHDSFRKVVSRAYTPRRIAALEDRIRELCAEYLDPFVGEGGFDFVRDFGMPPCSGSPRRTTISFGNGAMSVSTAKRGRKARRPRRRQP
jgi:cytochrome P450